jgi:hypothetical protein
MINQNSVQAVSDFRLDENFFKPHTEYNIKYLLNTIYNSFGIDNGKTLPEDCLKNTNEVNHVIFMLLDGFGYSLLEEVLPTLPKEIKDSLEENLRFSKITTIYPSATTAVIPFLMTGYLPEESGIYEWWQYEHNTEKIISPFLYRYLSEDGAISIENLENIYPKKIYKESRFYKNLQSNDVEVFVYTNPIFNTPFNSIGNGDVIKRDSHRITNQRVDVLKDLESNLDKKTFHYIYDPDVDAIEHMRGRSSKEAVAIAKSKLYEIYELITDINNRELQDDVKIFITADHGLCDYNFDNVLNIDEAFKDIWKYLEKNSDGEYVTGGGSPRVLVLHIKDEFIDEFIAKVSPIIKDRAVVYRRDELFNNGLLNTDVVVSEEFNKNYGNVILFSNDEEGIWFKEDDRIEFKAHHGGLSSDELHIPLMVF